MGTEMTYAWSTVQKISDMGPSRRGEPTGYPDVAETWLGATTVIARMNFAAPSPQVRCSAFPLIRHPGKVWTAHRSRRRFSGTTLRSRHRKQLPPNCRVRVLRPPLWLHWCWVRLISKGDKSPCGRVFLRGSTVAMVGMEQVSVWLARVAAQEGRKRKTLVVISYVERPTV